MPPPSARETALRGVIVNTVIDGRLPSLDFDLQHFHDLRRIETDSLKLFGCALLGILKRVFIFPNRCGHNVVTNPAIRAFVDKSLYEPGQRSKESGALSHLCQESSLRLVGDDKLIH